MNYGTDQSAVSMLLEGKTLHEIKESLTRLTRNYYNRRTQERVRRIFSEDETGVMIAAGIRDKYGIEGLRAMVCHIALDYIEQLYLRNYSTEEISWRIQGGKKGERLSLLLKKANLDYLYDYLNNIIEDISRRRAPSQILNSQREEDERLRGIAEGIDGYIFVNGKKLQPLFGIKRIKAEIRRGGRVRVGIALRRWTVRKRYGIMPLTLNGEYIEEDRISAGIHPIVMRIIERYPIERPLMPSVNSRVESRGNDSIVYHTLEVEISSFEDFEIVLREVLRTW